MLPTKTNSFDIVAVKSMTIQDLKAELAKTLTVTAEYLMYVAAIWRELETRGEDLSELRQGMMSYIPLIATNQLDARLVVNYAGQKTLLSSMAKLPLKEQQKLAEKGSLDVVILGDDNQQLIKEVKISDLTAAQVYQAIGDGKIKTPEQQYQILLVRNKVRSKSKLKKTYRLTQNLKIDGKNLVIAGKHAVSIELLKKYLEDNNEL